jgi:release factor glutamine methyltransferase
MGDDIYEGTILRLRAAGCVAAEEEAAELIAAATSTGGDQDVLEQLIARREQGEPLAWVTGTLQFCALRLAIDADVYVPRLQSEELARRAAAQLPSGGRAADLCSGAGAIAAYLAASTPEATVVAIDRDAGAVRNARRNHPLVVQGESGKALRSRSFEVVTAVAPYVPRREMRFLPPDTLRYEPRAALDGGRDGLDVVRQVVECASRILKRGGWLFLEVGGDQADVLGIVLQGAGFAEIGSWRDDEGDLRGMEARLA